MLPDELIQRIPSSVMEAVGRAWCRKQKADQDYAEAMRAANEAATRLELQQSISPNPPTQEIPHG